MYQVPFEYLVSPVTKSVLVRIDENTAVDADGNRFFREPRYGVWNFIPSSSPLYTPYQWSTFQELIRNFVVSYEQDPNANVSYDIRPDALDFGDFCRFTGLVLDVGCGPHRVPSYIRFRRNDAATYFGLDILSGEHPKNLQFVQAMGEHIPFRDDLFDVTVSGTSLLHYVSVEAGLGEVLRVTKPSGHACIWLGIKDPAAPRPAESPDWYKRLKTPAGAENPFHYKRLSTADFEKLCSATSARIIEKEEHPVDEWRRNVFYRLAKS